jgi:hypothetical protein
MMSEQQYVSPEDMATMHGVAPNTIYRILRDDETKSEADRRIPGAIKRGGKRRGVWLIPREIAENWQRSPAGRKSKPE